METIEYGIRIIVNGREARARVEQVNTGLHRLEQQSKTAATAAQLLNRALAGLAAVASVRAFFEINAEMERLENSARAVTGSVGEANRIMAEAARIADQYGADVVSVADAYIQMRSSIDPAVASTEQLGAVIDSLTAGFSALGLSAYQQENALRAVVQMMSKGTVQAEELKGQLGEAFMPALNLMAKGLDRNKKELLDLVNRGMLPAKEAVAALAIEMQKQFGGRRVDTLRAQVNRLNNSFREFMKAVGDTGAVDAAATSISNLSDFVWALGKFINDVRPAVRGFFDDLLKESLGIDLGAIWDGLIEGMATAVPTAKAMLADLMQFLASTLSDFLEKVSLWSRQHLIFLPGFFFDRAKIERLLLDMREFSHELRNMSADWKASATAANEEIDKALKKLQKRRSVNEHLKHQQEELLRLLNQLKNTGPAAHKRTADEAKKHAKEIEVLKRRYNELLTTAQERLLSVAADLRKLYDAGQISGEQYFKGLQKYVQDHFEEIWPEEAKRREAAENQIQAWRDAWNGFASDIQNMLANAFNNVFDNGLKGFKSFGQQLLAYFKGVAAKLMAMLALRGLGRIFGVSLGGSSGLAAYTGSGNAYGQVFGVVASAIGGKALESLGNIAAEKILGTAATEVGRSAISNTSAGAALDKFIASPAGTVAGYGAIIVGSGYTGYQVGSVVGGSIYGTKAGSTAAGAGAGAGAGAATGAIIGSVFPGIGTAIGAIVGAIVGAIGGGVGGGIAGGKRKQKFKYGLVPELPYSDIESDNRIRDEGVQIGYVRPTVLGYLYGKVRHHAVPKLHGKRFKPIENMIEYVGKLIDTLPDIFGPERFEKIKAAFKPYKGNEKGEITFGEFIGTTFSHIMQAVDAALSDSVYESIDKLWRKRADQLVNDEGIDKTTAYVRAFGDALQALADTLPLGAEELINFADSFDDLRWTLDKVRTLVAAWNSTGREIKKITDYTYDFYSLVHQLGDEGVKTLAEAIYRVGYALKENRIVIEENTKTAAQRLAELADVIEQRLTYGVNDALPAIQAFGQIIKDLKDRVVKALIEIPQALDAAIEDIQLAAMTQEEQYNYFVNRAEGLAQAIRSIDDPTILQETVKDIIQRTSQAFSLLPDDVKTTFAGEFVGFLNDVRNEANAQLQNIQNQIDTLSNNVLDNIADRVTNSAAYLERSSQALHSASNRLEQAASRLENAEVNLVVNEVGR